MSGYCDQRCDRPEGHDGMCWGNNTQGPVGQVWREATPEEETRFRAEHDEWLATQGLGPQAWRHDVPDPTHPEVRDTLTVAEYVASLPQRMADAANALNTGLAGVLPEGMRFEWGISDDEITAETATFEASRANFIDQVMRWPYQLRHPRRDPFHRVELPAACYRSEYGFMVHVKDACRCK